MFFDMAGVSTINLFERRSFNGARHVTWQQVYLCFLVLIQIIVVEREIFKLYDRLKPRGKPTVNCKRE